LTDRLIERAIRCVGADDDQRGIKKSLRAQFGNNLTERLVDEIKFTDETFAGSPENVRIAAVNSGDGINGQLFADAYRLKIRAEQSRDADLGGAIMVIAIDLIDDRSNVKRVVALDVVEARGPAVIRRGIRKVHGCATGKLRQRHWN
jgi:hypothetical protein